MPRATDSPADLWNKLEAFAVNNHLFYHWLIQYDLLAGDHERLAKAIVITSIWNQVYAATGQPPDSLPLEATLFVARSHAFRILPAEPVQPPASDSSWAAFYLDHPAYDTATAQIDTLIADELLRVADRHIDEKEHRF